MNPRKLQLIVTLSSVSFAQSISAAVIYRETFGNNSAGNLAMASSSIGWNALYTTTVGGDLVDGSATAGVIGVTSGTGVPTGLDNVNAGESLSTTNGFVFNSFVIAGLDYTAEYTIDRDAFTLNSVSWNANRITGASGVPTQNFAVQISGSWYVTTPPATSNVGGTSNAFNVTNNLITINLETVTWNSLTAAVGAPISVGASTALPTGDITAFGIFYNHGTTAITSRFDTVEIVATAIPEASALALSAVVGMLGLSVRRRNRG